MPFTPHEAGTHTINRARSLLKAAEADAIDASTSRDMVSLSLVLGVSGLDTYLHRLVLARAFGQNPRPKKLAELSIPFESLVEMADTGNEAAKEGRATRNRVQAKRMLRDALLRKTFQSARGVQEALTMAGKSGWSSISRDVAEAGESLTKAEVERRLNGIAGRRNAIVHEGDYRRLERPQNSDREPIDPAVVARDLDFLERLIEAIHKL